MYLLMLFLMPIISFSQDFYLGLSYKVQKTELNLEEINNPLVINILSQFNMQPILLDISLAYHKVKAKDLIKIEYDFDYIKVETDIKYQLYDFEPFFGIQVLFSTSSQINRKNLQYTIGETAHWSAYGSREIDFFSAIGISYNIKINHFKNLKLTISKNKSLFDEVGIAYDPNRKYSFWEFGIFYQLN